MTPNNRPVEPVVAATSVCLALVLMTGVPAPTAHASEHPTVALLAGVHELQVVSSDGARIELPLEPGVRFRRAATLEDGWIAAGVREDRTLLLVRARDVTGARPERAVTPSPGGRFVADPVPLVADGRLHGLAWLAGRTPRTLGVRYAAREGDGWGPTEVVSGAGPGSQLALTGAVLDGETVHLAWSAFDGNDDEVVWARRAGGAWSEPARVGEDNLVPDITPTLTVLDDRPVLAWSRYDARTRSYRLALSRRDGDAWSAPEPYGPAGSLYPRFDATEAGALLLFREAVSGVWTVLRLDGDLRPTARASVESSGDEGPAVLGAGPDGVEVVPGPDRTAVELRWTMTP